MSLTDWLLLAPVPYLAICATFMLVGLFTGPRANGGFRLVLTWPWLVVTLPTVIAGLIGIARAVSH